jgi:hypothetical protein
VAVDNPVPIATPADMKKGAFRDLVRSIDEVALADFMVQATRACETETQRRLTLFTDLVETHRAEGVDPDEYSGNSLMPLDLVGALGRSKALAYGAADNLVRRCWLSQYAPQFPEYWSYTNVSVEVVLSYGGSQTFTGNAITGPEVDSGQIWFKAGSFIPVGSLIRATYSGGYHTFPADLVRACVYMGAAIVARELDPMQQTGHDPSQLEATAAAWLTPYGRD